MGSKETDMLNNLDKMPRFEWKPEWPTAQELLDDLLETFPDLRDIPEKPGPKPVDPQPRDTTHEPDES